MRYVVAAGEEASWEGRLRGRVLIQSFTMKKSAETFLIYDWCGLSHYSIQSLSISLHCNPLFPQHDQNFELITERGNRLGIEWGKVRNLASDSSSSSSLKDNDNAIIISITPSALQQSGDVVQVGRGKKNGEGRGRESGV